MRIKVNPWPAVFVSVICEKHDCRVLLDAYQPPHPSKDESSQVQMTVNRCEVGGIPRVSDGCEQSWAMFINGPGAVMVME